MTTKPISIILILALAASQFSCASYVEQSHRIDTHNMKSLYYRNDVKHTSILEAVTKSGERYTFLAGRPGMIVGNTIRGAVRLKKSLRLAKRDIDHIVVDKPDNFMARSKDGSLYSFDRYTHTDEAVVGSGWVETIITLPLQEIESVWLKYQKKSRGRSLVKSIAAGVFGYLAVGAILLLLFWKPSKGSCPFIYSFDGDNYIFDAEPFSGAISRGYQRTELCPLDHIEAVDGEYRLLMTNEQDETDYVDEISLLAVDHPPHTQILADHRGTLHCIRQPIAPLHAIDKQGRNVTGMITNCDHTLWFSRVKDKDQLIIRFPKPTAAPKAKLVFNGQ